MGRPEYEGQAETPLRQAYRVAKPIQDADPAKRVVHVGQHPLRTGESVMAVTSSTHIGVREFRIGEGNVTLNFSLRPDRTVRFDGSAAVRAVAAEALDSVPGAYEERVDDSGKVHVERSKWRDDVGSQLDQSIQRNSQSVDRMGLTILNGSQVHNLLADLKRNVTEPLLDDMEIIEPEDELGPPSPELVSQFEEVLGRLSKQTTVTTSVWHDDTRSNVLTTVTDEAANPGEVTFESTRTWTSKESPGLMLEDTDHWVYEEGREPQFYTIHDVNAVTVIFLPDDHPAKALGLALLESGERQRREAAESDNHASADSQRRLIEVLSQPEHIVTLRQQEVENRILQLSEYAPDEIIAAIGDNGFPSDWLEDRQVPTLEAYWNARVDNFNRSTAETDDDQIDDSTRVIILDALVTKQPRADELNTLVRQMHELADREDIPESQRAAQYAHLHAQARQIVEVGVDEGSGAFHIPNTAPKEETGRSGEVFLAGKDGEIRRIDSSSDPSDDSRTEGGNGRD